jgi:hypothetical protein
MWIAEARLRLKLVLMQRVHLLKTCPARAKKEVLDGFQFYE